MGNALVTGAGSGIGIETVRRLVREGWRVFANVRRAETAEELRAEFGMSVHPLRFDVRDQPAVERAAEEVGRALEGERLDALVNNAGMGNPAPFLHQAFDELREQLEVNLLAVVGVTRAFGPLLAARDGGEGGRIVNMSSLGGVTGYPFAAAYCASKHGLEGLSESLRRELWREGIRVIVVAPAIVRTPVWEKVAAQSGPGRFEATPYGAAYREVMERVLREGERGLPAEAVADTIWQALTERRPAARYAPARRPLLEERLAHVMPRGLVDRLLARRLGLRPDRD